jgi:hypothetical protein
MSDLRTPANLHDSTKKPNFMLIVILFAAFILLFCGAAYLFLHKDAGHVDPHRANPTPNSRLTVPIASPVSTLAA